MYIFGALFVGFGDIYFFEIFDCDLDISAGDLDIDDDFLILSASKCVAILLIGLKSISN